jgi:hypothetical protein
MHEGNSVRLALKEKTFRKETEIQVGGVLSMSELAALSMSESKIQVTGPGVLIVSN